MAQPSLRPHIQRLKHTNASSLSRSILPPPIATRVARCRNAEVSGWRDRPVRLIRLAPFRLSVRAEPGPSKRPNEGAAAVTRASLAMTRTRLRKTCVARAKMGKPWLLPSTQDIAQPRLLLKKINSCLGRATASGLFSLTVP